LVARGSALGGVFACERLELGPTLGPKPRGVDRVFGDLERQAAHDHERLALELVLIDAGQNGPVDLGVGVPQRAEQAARDAIEQLGRRGHPSARLARWDRATTRDSASRTGKIGYFLAAGAASA